MISLDLQNNNILKFPITIGYVIYGPNGAGKTSLTSLLRMEDEDNECAIEIDGTPYTIASEKVIDIIEDQNERILFEGSTEDFILGDNIKREYELKRNLDQGFDQLFKNVLVSELKNNFGIGKKNTPFDEIITNPKIREYVSDIANC